jgi:hypothetical protein
VLRRCGIFGVKSRPLRIRTENPNKAVQQFMLAYGLVHIGIQKRHGGFLDAVKAGRGNQHQLGLAKICMGAYAARQFVARHSLAPAAASQTNCTRPAARCARPIMLIAVAQAQKHNSPAKTTSSCCPVMQPMILNMHGI